MKTTKMALAVISLLTNSNDVLAAQLKSQNNLKSFNMDDDLVVEEKSDNDDDESLDELNVDTSSSGSEISPSNRKYHWSSDQECDCSPEECECNRCRKPPRCPCGGMGCSKCNCKDEINEVFTKVSCTHEKVCHI